MNIFHSSPWSEVKVKLSLDVLLAFVLLLKVMCVRSHVPPFLSASFYLCSEEQKKTRLEISLVCVDCGNKMAMKML